MSREWTSHPPGTKAVRVDLPEAVHDKLRILAAEQKVSMAELARQVVTKAVVDRFPELDAEEPTPKKPKKK